MALITNITPSQELILSQVWANGGSCAFARTVSVAKMETPAIALTSPQQRADLATLVEKKMLVYLGSGGYQDAAVHRPFLLYGITSRGAKHLGH